MLGVRVQVAFPEGIPDFVIDNRIVATGGGTFGQRTTKSETTRALLEVHALELTYFLREQAHGDASDGVVVDEGVGACDRRS
jgi:hypothetical protein